VIRKVGGKYVLYSGDGSKRLSKPGSHEAAEKREKQVNYFKYIKKSYSDFIKSLKIY
jgi:hypothetical protein